MISKTIKLTALGFCLVSLSQIFIQCGAPAADVMLTADKIADNADIYIDGKWFDKIKCKPYVDSKNTKTEVCSAVLQIPIQSKQIQLIKGEKKIVQQIVLATDSYWHVNFEIMQIEGMQADSAHD